MERQNILVAVLVIIILITAYIWYNHVQSRPSEAVTRSSEGAIPAAKELLVLLQQLERVRIDTSFFEDPVYKSLIDLTPQIVIPEVRGRINPFAPLE